MKQRPRMRTSTRRLTGVLAAALGLGVLPLAPPASSATIQLQDFTETACVVDDKGTPATADDTTVVPEDGFTDVNSAGTPTNPANIHEFAIDCVAWYKIAAGAGGKLFDPGGNVTRAQMATFLANLIDYVAKRTPTPPGGTPDGLRNPDTFTTNAFPCDVDPADVHYASIQRLADKLIVSGSGSNASGNCFDPNGTVRRDQMATFLKNATAVVGEAIPAAADDYFTDVAGNPHAANIDAVAAAGIASGSATSSGGASLYNPRGEVRRDQMASFLARMLERLVASTGVKPPPDAQVSLPGTVGQGKELTGSVRSVNGTIDAVAVSGCGVEPPVTFNEPAPPAPDVPDVTELQFQVTIPPAQPVGTCELTVKSTLTAEVTMGSRTSTEIVTIEVTGGA